MRNLYAFLLFSMSLEDAKRTLGFPSNANPSPDDIRKAWRQKAFEVHPDRGGDPKKMVEVNVAKDILDGKQRPTYDRSDSYSPPPKARPTDYGYSAPKEKPKDHVVTFETAVQTAHIPSNVEWLFVTDMQRSKHNYSGDESQRYVNAFVAFGRTEYNYVYAVARHTVLASFYVGGGSNTDVWEAECILTSKTAFSSMHVSKQISTALKKVQFDGSFNNKVSLCPGWEFSKKLPLSGTMPLKRALMELGLLEKDDPTVKTLRTVIELELLNEYSDRAGYYSVKSGPYDNADGFYRVTIRVNSAMKALSEEDTKKFFAFRIGGQRAMQVIFGDYYYRGGKKVLTLSKFGKPVIQWLADNTSLPADMRQVMAQKASEMA